MPDQQNNYENAKVICVDVSDVIKLLKYMQEFLAFSNPNNITSPL
jgi:hypothetical protein